MALQASHIVMRIYLFDLVQRSLRTLRRTKALRCLYTMYTIQLAFVLSAIVLIVFIALRRLITFIRGS